MAAATGNRMNGSRPDTRGATGADGQSIVGYIPDDVSSVHSSALGGGAALSSQGGAYPRMFQGFQETWPTLARGPNGTAAHKAPESVAGESVAASEVTNGTSQTGGHGQGGVSLAGLSINDLNKQASLSQSDKLRRYVEAQQPAPIGAGRTRAAGDEDARSVSTAFQSQVGYD